MGQVEEIRVERDAVGSTDGEQIEFQWLLSLFDEDTDDVRVFRERASKLAREFVHSSQITAGTELRSLREAFGGARVPEDPAGLPEYINFLENKIIPHSMHVSSRRFIGHMTSALPCLLRELGTLLVAMNQNTVKLETSKSVSLMERQAIGMLHRLIYHMPDRFYQEHVQDAESTLGVITSGGTVANTTALWCARNCTLVACEGFAGVEVEGMPAALNHYGYNGAAIIGSSLMHYSLDKAAALLGLGSGNLLRVPVNAENRVNVAALRRRIKECRDRGICVLAIVGIGGTTESGAIDPLDQLADIAEEFGIHYHVDAAWGGAMQFSRKYRSRLSGIERADSVTIDGHKQMYLPMGTGMAVFRDPKLARVIEKQARYIVRRGSYDLGRRSLEGSRPANALYVHAAFHSLGRKGYELLIEESVRKAAYLYERVRQSAEFEPIVAPQMNILTYRYLPEWARPRAQTLELTPEEQVSINEINQQLQRLQRAAGKSFVSRTTLETTRYGAGIPIVVLRAVLANPLTTDEDIDTVLREQVAHGAEAEAICQEINRVAQSGAAG
ncbi:MAG: aminotransferase class V-fold PLP-dependent enzyme [Bryobacteraceae bacterium]